MGTKLDKGEFFKKESQLSGGKWGNSIGRTIYAGIIRYGTFLHLFNTIIIHCEKNTCS